VEERDDSELFRRGDGLETSQSRAENQKGQQTMMSIVVLHMLWGA
jgi:hypothetical protein